MEKIAAWGATTCQQRYKDARIIRNPLKIQATVHHAQCFLALQAASGSLDQYIWNFVEGKPKINPWKAPRSASTYPTFRPDQQRLEKKGFKFVGSTIIYAYMQAGGLVNDHTLDCFRHQELS